MKNKSFSSSTSKSFNKSAIRKSQMATPSPGTTKKTQELQNALKPVVSDFSRPCKKDESGKKINSPKKSENSMLKNPEATLRLKFFDQKNFDTEDFIKSHTDEKIKCIVCNGLLIDPVSCYKCSKNFCSKCIKSELLKHNKCPSCFNMIFPELMPQVDLLSDGLKGKEIDCPYIGCKDKNSIMNIRTHLDSCIFKNIKSSKQKHVNKIIHQDPATDPLMKLHLLKFLKTSNSKVSYREDFSKKPGIEFSSKLPDFKSQVGILNDHISKTILDLAKSTKITNEKLKNMINS
jgi:hypothetical protein